MIAAHAILRRLANRKTMLWRCFWALVLLLHAPVTWQVIRGSHPPGWSSIFLLLLSNAFFLMEVCLARCVGLINDRRSAMVFLLVIALLHVGVLERGYPVLADSLNHGASLIFTVAGTIILAGFFAAQCERILVNSNSIRGIHALPAHLSRFFPSLILAPQVRRQPFGRHRGPPRP